MLHPDCGRRKSLCRLLGRGEGFKGEENESDRQVRATRIKNTGGI